MGVISMKDLLEAGVHFGHQTKRWNPKMKKFLFTRRKGIHIIDLQKTAEFSEKAYAFVKDQSAEGKIILFVGTKKQAQEEVKKAAEKCGMPYIVYRWLGGMLTNFVTVRSSINRLKRIETILEKSEESNLTKRELLSLKRERDKLDQVFCGIKDMSKLPDILFVVDSEKEETAIKEATNLRIPIVGVVDTNGNPDLINYPIPGNDDAIRAITLFANLISDAVIKGRKKMQLEHEGEAKDAETAEQTPVINEEEEQIKAKYSEYEFDDEDKEIKSFESFQKDEADMQVKKDDTAAETGEAADVKAETEVKSKEKKAEGKKTDEKKDEEKKTEDKKSEEKKVEAEVKQETKEAKSKETKEAKETKTKAAKSEAREKKENKTKAVKTDDSKKAAKPGTKEKTTKAKTEKKSSK